MSDLAIEVDDLRIAYGEVEAVRGISFHVRRGEVFAVLGPNGAGKTSTIEHLEGFRARAGGSARVLGADPEQAGRGRIGVVLQESSIEPQLTVREVLTLYAGYYERPLAVDDAIGLAGLDGLGDRLGGRLSGGQQRRVDVALALIGDPELVFLDEPTTGFDPQARRATWEMIDGLRALGKTIVLTTHYLEEAERLADRIAVVAAGEIVAEGTPATLGARDRAGSRVSFVAEAVPPGEWQRDGARYVTTTDDPLGVVAALRDWGGEVRELEVRPKSLEDVYLELVS